MTSDSLNLQKILLLVFIVASSQSDAQKCGKNIDRDASCSNDSVCPTWYACDEQKQCNCGGGKDYNNRVICDNENLRSAVLSCNCVTYDIKTKSTSVGSCYYNCAYDKQDAYTWLPQNPEALINGSVCTRFNRTGLLCGDCEEEHSPLVLSYNLSCVRCPDGHKNWWKFFVVGFLPLTFFYLIVILFNINVTSTRLHGVVWYSQVLSIPPMVRLILPIVSLRAPALLTPIKITFIFFSFWNLDILRSVLPDICLNITTLQALALDYLIALYPFLLILISCIIIELHDKKFLCTVIMWKPFQKLLSIFHKSYDVRTSVIDSFATFFMLAHVKILSVTTDVLTPTVIYQLGSNASTVGVYYSPTVQYFGDEHLPYAILALVIFTLFVMIPTFILFVYPFQCFQKFLSLFPFNWHYLRAFVDSFQGCYKDGTEPGTFDCRWLSAFTVSIRLIFFVIFGITRSCMFFVYAISILIIFLIAIINIQPYKTYVRHPSTDSTFFVFLIIVFILFLGREPAVTTRIEGITMIISGFIFALIPLFYTIFLIISWLVTRIKKRQAITL